MYSDSNFMQTILHVRLSIIIGRLCGNILLLTRQKIKSKMHTTTLGPNILKPGLLHVNRGLSGIPFLAPAAGECTLEVPYSVFTTPP